MMPKHENHLTYYILKSNNFQSLEREKKGFLQQMTMECTWKIKSLKIMCIPQTYGIATTPVSLYLSTVSHKELHIHLILEQHGD